MYVRNEDTTHHTEPKKKLLRKIVFEEPLKLIVGVACNREKGDYIGMLKLTAL